MSKYTTEVRFICEHDAELENSLGATFVNQVLDKAWNKTFTTDVAFFDENYRAFLCKKILKHFYTREIGAETVGLWKLWMNTKLEEVMPYYNSMYKSALLEFNPFYDIDLTRKQDRKTDTGSKNDGTANNTQDVTSNRNTDSKLRESEWDLYSDTPQGAVTDLEKERYLTNARKITRDNEANTKETGNVNTVGTNVTSTTGTVNSVDDYLETVRGKAGGASYSKLLNEYRKTFLNIDMMVIEEFEELFFGLW